MKFSQRVAFTALVLVAYGAALVAVVSAFVTVVPLLVAGMIVTAAALTVVNWLWSDYDRKIK